MKRLFLNDSIVMSLVLLMIILTIFHSYLLFHIGVEFFSILISFSIFIFGWNTKQHFKNSYLLFIAVAYLFIAFFDMAHTLTYQEMGIFDINPNFAIETWIASRFLESLTFLAAYYFMDKKVSPNRLLLAYFVIALLLFGTIMGGYFPDCYIDGEGLTPFKKISEYVISLILFASAVLLYKSPGMSPKIKRLVSTSIFLTIFSELSFTLYHDMFGIFNVIGHILKIVSFYLLYKAILEVGLTNPMELLTLKLEKSEEDNRHKQELLIQQSRLIGAGEALSNVAHQWRQPLSALGLVIQDIEDAYQYGELDDAYLADKVNTSMETIENLSTTINRFTTFFAPSNRIETFDIRKSVETVLAMLAANLKRQQIDVTMNASCDCNISGGQKDFSQTLFHILTNAIDIFKERQIEKRKITVTINKRDDGKTVVAIEDNAGGIDPAVKEKLFEPYSTTKHRGSGVGLGLYISKMIIEENMGGKLEAENGKEGAVFKIVV